MMLGRCFSVYFSLFALRSIWSMAGRRLGPDLLNLNELRQELVQAADEP
jgi:hypothetical protein